jgi:VanZ family protein
LFSVTKVVAEFLLYFPVGSLLAVWPLRRRGPLGHILPAVYVAVALELGQVFIAGRWFDSTDVLVQCAAAGVGWIIARRAGFAPYGELLPPDATTAPVRS